MPPVNLANVNISLNEFQRISSGTHNAGEVKLAGEGKLAKMNNHVKHTEKNNERISHVEVVAIKQSLVKALSQHGVGQDEIDRIRKDLGLAPKDAADKELLARSVVPLTRQQIRAILDRNAAAINAFNAQHHPGAAVLRASTQIYGPGGMDEASAARRDAVNAALADKNRTLDVNTAPPPPPRWSSRPSRPAAASARRGGVPTPPRRRRSCTIASGGL